MDLGIFAIKITKYNFIFLFFFLAAAEITALCCFVKDVGNDQKIFHHYRQGIKFDFTWSYGTAWAAVCFTILCFGSNICSILNRVPNLDIIEEKKI